MELAGTDRLARVASMFTIFTRAGSASALNSLDVASASSSESDEAASGWQQAIRVSDEGVISTVIVTISVDMSSETDVSQRGTSGPTSDLSGSYRRASLTPRSRARRAARAPVRPTRDTREPGRDPTHIGNLSGLMASLPAPVRVRLGKKSGQAESCERNGSLLREEMVVIGRTDGWLRRLAAVAAVLAALAAFLPGAALAGTNCSSGTHYGGATISAR